MTNAHRFVAILVSTLLFAACSREPAAPPPEPKAAAPAGKSWPEFVDAFIEARMTADPYFAVQAGRHEFDGKMPDWSRAAIEADIAQTRRFLDELRQHDAAKLNERRRFERDYLEWVMERQIFWDATAEQPFRNPAWYLDRLDPSMYLEREYAPLPKRLEGYLGYARALPALARNIRENLQTPLPKAFIERGAAGFAGYATFFRNEMPAIFAGLGDEKLKSDLTTATAASAQAMDELATWLEAQRSTGTDGFALGSAKFSEMLRETERIDIPLEELELAGRQDLARNMAALKEACAAYAPKAGLAACVNKMRADKPTGGSVEGARAQLKELRQFVIDRKIVTI
ncbi:MAG: DUF885 family protein, partial [Steroidobacteraceae bacterium]|nr:DUF885 family protein [Steroidobacteraceae bacterium]